MASAEEAAEIIIRVADAQEQKIDVVKRFGTELVSQATKTPAGATAQALPTMVKSNQVGQRLIISAKGRVADTVESEESAWSFPIAYYRMEGKNAVYAYTSDVAMDSWTGFTTAGTVDVVLSTTSEARLATLDAPEGYVIGLGTGKYHVYLGDDTA